MSEEEKKFTLEKKKLSSMGPDTVVLIPRALIKHKVLDPNKRYNITFVEINEENRD